MPQGRVIVAIGDVHGCADLLVRLHLKIDHVLEPCRDASITEIYLGDIIDRGPDTKGVIGTLLERSKTRDVLVLRGNHEETLLDVLDGKTKASLWIAEGGAATLSSYGASVLTKSDDDIRIALKDYMSEEHLNFLRHAQHCYEEAGYVFVHAGLRPKVLLERQLQRDMLWITDEFLSFKGQFEGVVIHGHSIVDRPEFYENRIAVDTGAFQSGRLTGLILARDGMRVIST